MSIFLMYVQATRTNRELAVHALNRLSSIRDVGSSALDQIVIGECLDGSIKANDPVEIIGFSANKTPAIVTRVFKQSTRRFLHLDRLHPFRPGMIIATADFAEPMKALNAEFWEGRIESNPAFVLDLDEQIIKIFGIEIPCVVSIRAGTSSAQEWQIELEEWTYIPAGWSFSVMRDNDTPVGWAEVR